MQDHSDLSSQSNEAVAEILLGATYMGKEIAKTIQTCKDELTKRVESGAVDKSFTHNDCSFSYRTTQRWAYSEEHKAYLRRITRPLDEAQRDNGLATQVKSGAWYLKQSSKDS